MKLGSLVVLLAVLMGIAVDARAENLADVVQAAKDVLREIPVDYEYARRVELGISSAYAFSGDYQCFYAGWPSLLTTRDGHRYCSRPTSLPHYTKYMSAGLSCTGTNQILCNPLLFGKGEGKGLCAPVGNMAFSQCESQFGSQKNPYSYLDRLTADEIGEVRQTLKMAKEVCIEGKVGTVQKGSGMCARFISKMNKLEPKINGVKPETDQSVKQEIKKDNKTKVTKENATTFREYLDAVRAEKNNPPVEAQKKEIKSINCDHCGQNGNAQQDVPPTFAALLETYKKQQNNPVVQTASLENLDASTKYEQIKDRFISSGKCHRWERLPEDAKIAFKMGLFKDEITAFRVPPRAPSVMNESTAFENLKRAFGWADGSAELKSWRDRAATLGPVGTVQGDRDRMKFQVDLMKLIKQNYDAGRLKSEVDSRALLKLTKQGLSDCDFPSKEAFSAALASIKKHSGNAKWKASPDILTIADRSLKKNQERLTTINLKTGEVLYQSDAHFGDADGNDEITGPEADKCSNAAKSNASPHGLSVTIGKRQMNTMDAVGLFLKNESLKTDDPVERQIAFHKSGMGPLGGYNGDYRKGLFQKLINDPQSRNGNGVSNFDVFFAGAMSGDGPHNTNGCVGLPQETVGELQNIVGSGTYVYFYCPPNMIPANERR